MKILKFNEGTNFPIDLNTTYEISMIDENGDVVDFDEHRSYDYNPFDLEDVVGILMIFEKKYKGLFINKITVEPINKEIIDKIKLKLYAKNYNL
jgi:hypothetical protein